MCNMCTRDIEPVSNGEVGNVDINNRKSNKLEAMKRRHNIITDPHDGEKQKEVAYQPDLLAVSTQLMKFTFAYMKSCYAYFQKTKAFNILTKTPQPVHAILAGLLLFIWVTQPGQGSARGWWALYVGAVAIHLGAQIWMTFISGIVLYFALPRHDFGRIQTILFPVYYAFNSIMSLLALLAYSRIQFITNFQNVSIIPFAMLLIVFLIESTIRLYMIRPMLRAKHVKTQMEEAAGSGQEVGKLLLGELAHCPRYMRVLKLFRAYHSFVAMGTMITLGCSLYVTMTIVDSLCGL